MRISQTMPAGQVPHEPPQPSTEHAGLGGQGRGTHAHDSQAVNSRPSLRHLCVPVLGCPCEEQGHDRTSPGAQTRATGAGAGASAPHAIGAAAARPPTRSDHSATTFAETARPLVACSTSSLLGHGRRDSGEPARTDGKMQTIVGLVASAQRSPATGWSPTRNAERVSTIARAFGRFRVGSPRTLDASAPHAAGRRSKRRSAPRWQPICSSASRAAASTSPPRRSRACATPSRSTSRSSSGQRSRCLHRQQVVPPTLRSQAIRGQSRQPRPRRTCWASKPNSRSRGRRW